MSVGNVGQLTIDLIVSTLHMDRVGYLSTDAVYPVIGNDPFSVRGSKSQCLLVTAIEGRYSGHLSLVKRFERSDGLDTALYKNYLYLFLSLNKKFSTHSLANHATNHKTF